MSENREIPNGWVWAKLGEVCKLKNGYAFKSSDYSKEGIPVIRISDINEGVVSVDESVKVIANQEYDNYIISKDEILVAMSGATTGKFGIFRNNIIAYQNQRVGKFQILDINALNNTFLLFLLYSLKRKILEDAYGGAQPNISSGKIEELEIPLPPFSEQHRIVAKIEELFSSLDKGIESLKTAQQQLKVYRQAVLKWAFEGKLTNKNMLEGKLPEGWKWVKLREVCEKIQDGSHFSPQVQYDEPGENRFLYITAKNIRNNYMDFSKLTYVDREFHESIYERCNPEYGDVLLTKDGVNTGEVTLNSLKEAFSLLSSVCIFKTKGNELDSGFLKYFIQSPLGSRAVSDSMTGTAIKRIILRKIKDAEIIQPLLPEQHAIVAEIESRLSVCNKIEESIEQNLKQSEALRQSILKKAFEGKLVPQDPSDEPASVLLARIKAEREQNKPETPPRRWAGKIKAKKEKS